MSDMTWHNLDIARDSLRNGNFKTVAEKVDFALSAAMETIANVLPSASPTVLGRGVAVATEAMNALNAQTPIDRQSSNYIAGRIASAIDVLAYTASATVGETAVQKARQQPYAKILQWLTDGPLRNADVAKKGNWDKAYVSRLFGDLREMEVVTSHRSGRDVYNTLTPAGRLVVEEGVQGAGRVPVSDSNVHSFSASRFNLAEMSGPINAQEADLPRLSTAAAR